MTWLKQPQFFALITGTAILLNGCAGNREGNKTDTTQVTPVRRGPAPLERVVPREVTSFDEEQPVETEPTSTAPIAEPAPPIQSTTAAPPAPVPLSKRVIRYVNATTLNVRSRASANARIDERLPRNTAVTVTSETTERNGQKWSRIEYIAKGRKQIGWVATEFLSSASSVPPAPAAVGGSRSTNTPRSAPLKATTFNKPSGEYFEQFERLDYAPVPKPSYPGNPKIQAKGVYVSFNVLASDRFDSIINLLDTTELNALVIDFKDDVGGLLTKSATAARLVPQANATAKYNDVSELIQKLKAKNIYLIARIVTFKDPLYVKAHPESAIINKANGQVYKSGDGLSWSSPYDSGFRAYNIALAKEAAEAGFNEVQFDYVRFPDVPRAANLNYRNGSSDSIKAEVIQNFLLEARRALSPLKVYIAADVFGLVTTTVDDMRIGQYWEAVSNAVDYICPMMYPSHYANTVYQLPIPDARPYDLIYRGLADALARNKELHPPAQIRPWLQGFTASWVKGHINYGATEVKAQIRAAADQGVDSYLIWNPTGTYNPAAYR